MPNFVHTKVDPGRLSTASLSIEDSLRLVENALGVVDDSLRNTLLPTWSGPASEQFFSQYSIDTQNFKSFLKAMQVFNDKLRQAAGIYNNADGSAGELVSKLSVE